MKPTQADVCVIGSGIAGAIVAMECAAAGFDVVVLEAGARHRFDGPHIRLTERLVGNPGKSRMKIWLRRARYDPSDADSDGSPGYPLKGSALIAYGGSTLGWSGFAYRLKPEDFRLQTLTGRGIDWPISYDDLEPDYRRAEQSLRVAGDDTDPGHPPRSGPFPVTPARFHRRDDPFGEMMGHDAVMHHNGSIGFNGAPANAATLLRRLERSGRVQVRTETVATRLVVDSKGRCVSVETADRADESTDVEAQAYVVCAGGIESSKLLAASATASYPDGLGNHGGHLGHNLLSHTGVSVRAEFRGSGDGPIMPTAATRQYDTEEAQGAGKYLLMWRPWRGGVMSLYACVEQLPQPSNRVVLGRSTGSHGLTRTAIRFDHSEEHLRRAATIEKDLLAMLDKVGLRPVAEPGLGVHAHPMCTTRMSDDPAMGVVDRDLLVHGTRNIYVCGSSSFATGGAAHPTVTVAALAHRCGRHLAGKSARSAQGSDHD